MQTQKVVLFLQNAWSYAYAGGTWPRPSWLNALWACPTGRRLKILEEASPAIYLWVDNTTPIVGEGPNSVVPPDPDHIRGVIDRQSPDVVVMCGKQARKAVFPLWSGPALILPHPTHRVVTDKLYREAGTLLGAGIESVVELVQERGRFVKHVSPIMKKTGKPTLF